MLIILDAILFIDCVAAVVCLIYLVYGIKRELAAMPPYAQAVESGKLNYTVSPRLCNSLYGRFSYQRNITPETEYEAYRQDVFCKSLIRIAAVSFVFAVIADLCCFFDGFAAGDYTLGVYIALIAVVAGSISGILLGLYLSRLAYKNKLVETVSRVDKYVNEDGTLRTSSRNCYFAAYLVSVPTGWFIAAVIGFSVYTLILMVA